MTRRQVDQDQTICQPDADHAQGTITVEEALPMMNINGAYALWQDAAIGSLKKGKLADLVILSANPLAVVSDDLPSIQVLMTMVGGTTQFCASGQGSLCP